MSLLRTPAGAGLALAVALALSALVLSESPCERADGSIDAACIAMKTYDREEKP